MKRVGAHVSAAGGVQNAPLEAEKISGRAFALFTKNQKQWQAPPLKEEQIAAFKENCRRLGFAPGHILPHDSYLINLGNPDAAGRKKSQAAFAEEMRRCQILGLALFNFHPGSHKKMASEEKCLEWIAAGINRALDKTVGVTAVIENTAGQGGQVGNRFEHLALLIEAVEDQSRVGVCLDTCHLFAAGYDIRSRAAYEETMRRFDDIVGLRYLRAWHLNDAKAGLGSRIDRHHNLGKGELGLDPFRWLMNDPRLEEMPLVLETIDDTLWAEEIRLLYSLVE